MSNYPKQYGARESELHEEVVFGATTVAKNTTGFFVGITRSQLKGAELAVRLPVAGLASVTEVAAKIQSSSDNGVDDAWADVAELAEQTATASPPSGAEFRWPIPSGMEGWVRAVVTQTGGSLGTETFEWFVAL